MTNIRLGRKDNSADNIKNYVVDIHRAVSRSDAGFSTRTLPLRQFHFKSSFKIIVLKADAFSVFRHFNV